MPLRERIAIQSEQFTVNFTTTPIPIPGMELTVKAHSTFYIDMRFRLSTPNGTCGYNLYVDGWNGDIANQIRLQWNFYQAIGTPFLYQKDFPPTDPDLYKWEFAPAILTPSQSLLDGNIYVYGRIQNTQDFDQQLIVSFSKNSQGSFTRFVQIEGGRLLLYEDSNQFPSQSINSDMTHCGCCATAEISCCQTSLTINTINPSDSFDWKIVDSLGAVYTGTMETDSAGVGVITVGDGMDLPDGFLDAPGVGFKIEFLDGRPTIASKMACLDVELVSGAYLAIQDIGEPLP